MNPIVVTAVIVSIIAVIAVIAWLLYRANFRAKEITVKAGLVEAKMERDTASNPNAGGAKPRTEATQETKAGGRIIDSSIKASAESGARLKQKAEDEGSSITGSTIELD